MPSRTNDEWRRALGGSGREQAEALADLRRYLLRGVLYAFRRRRGSLAHLSAADVEALAEDCVQDALIAVLRQLGTFRGDSQFTTWVYKFAVNTALVAARREGGKRVRLDEVLAAGRAAPMLVAAAPDRVAMRAEAATAIRDAIQNELTERQRQALTAIVFEGIPLDELVRHWGSNRNAVYKLLHDARRKLKESLRRRDLVPGELLQLFDGDG
jgi:RNA polymerase sigma-70 factor, ECF subfamily